MEERKQRSGPSRRSGHSVRPLQNNPNEVRGSCCVNLPEQGRGHEKMVTKMCCISSALGQQAWRRANGWGDGLLEDGLEFIEQALPPLPCSENGVGAAREEPTPTA